MTQKIFWRDPYQTTLDTFLTQVMGREVTVAATIFYALSGGQESDEGTIANQRVQQARKEGQEIIYTLAADPNLQAGQAVQMTIDWPRRYRLMRLHFAAEIILALVYKSLPGIEKIGAHIAPDKARIDFKWPAALTPHFPALTTDAQALIAANRPIVSAFSDEAHERRYWEVADFARVPCGGTHLKTTGEVGELTLKRKNIGQGKERIEIYLY